MRKIWLLSLLLISSIAWGDSESTIGGRTGTDHIIQANGVSLRPRAYLNITGDTVTGSDSGGKTVITMSGLTSASADTLYIRKDGTSTTTAAIPFAQGINTAKVTNLTTNGFVKTTGSSGTLSVDTSSYVTGPGGSTTQMQYNNAGAFGGTSGYSWTGSFAQFAASQGVYFNGGSSDYIYGDGTNLKIAAANAVVIGNPGDIILGDSTLRTMYPQTDQKIDLGTASFRYNDIYDTRLCGSASCADRISFATASSVIANAATSVLVAIGGTTKYTFATSTLTLANAVNIALNTTTGTKIGTGTTQKLGFFNATPVVQQGATTDLGTVLSNLGLRASGTAYPITTSGAVTLGSLTSTRIPIAGTAGLLGDDADLTFTGGNTLNATNASVTTLLTTAGTMTNTSTGAMGWSVVTAANQACTTTCTNAAVFGQDTDAAPYPIVGTADATADRCVCAGAS